MAEFCDAYDTRTGDKLPHQVPEQHFELFPDAISREPVMAPDTAVFVQEPALPRIPTTRTPRAATTAPTPSAEKE